jgi:hypothetical protein
VLNERLLHISHGLIALPHRRTVRWTLRRSGRSRHFLCRSDEQTPRLVALLFCSHIRRCPATLRWCHLALGGVTLRSEAPRCAWWCHLALGGVTLRLVVPPCAWWCHVALGGVTLRLVVPPCARRCHVALCGASLHAPRTSPVCFYRTVFSAGAYRIVPRHSTIWPELPDRKLPFGDCCCDRKLTFRGRYYANTCSSYLRILQAQLVADGTELATKVVAAASPTELAQRQTLLVNGG